MIVNLIQALIFVFSIMKLNKYFTEETKENLELFAKPKVYT
jgi:hypothetical protein